MKTKSILICLLFTIFANLFTTAKAQVNVTDSLALVDLYNSTDGPHWTNHTNWLTTKPVSTWYAVMVVKDRVTKISFYNNELRGIIPASIGNLKKLTYLGLTTNYLSGTIPSTIGNLTSLTYLDLGNNQLTGVIPVSFSKLVNLTNLIMYNNQLSGTIPSYLGHFKNLFTLYLDGNQLTGAIPFSLNQLQSAYISLEHNQLTKFADRYPSNDTDNIFIEIEYNHFTFNGLQVIAKYYPNVYYYGQDTILPIHQNDNMLSVSAGGTMQNNTYKWHQVGVDTTVVIKKDSTFTPYQSGQYYVSVTNHVAKQLTLYSDTINYIMPTVQQSSNTFIAKAMPSATIIKHMQVFPNPAKDVIHVQVNGNAMIVLTNSAGKILLSKTINNSDAINVSSFANGVYYIQNKTTGETQKIVVVH